MGLEHVVSRGLIMSCTGTSLSSHARVGFDLRPYINEHVRQTTSQCLFVVVFDCHYVLGDSAYFTLMHIAVLQHRLNKSL
jgi:hypothetical protein